MQATQKISNDECVAGLHQFIAVAANIVYSLKGDLGSFLVQAETMRLSNIAARYSTHTKNNMPKALDDLSKIPVKVKDLIINSDYPEAIRIKWLKYVVFYEDFFRGILRHKVSSEQRDYIDNAKRILDIVKKLQKLTDSFSENVELVTVKQDMNSGLSHLLELDKIFSETFRLAQDSDLISSSESGR